MTPKPYELMVLFHPDLEIDLDKPLKKIENLIKDVDGKITTSDVWGKRKLAYKIKKQDFAVYVYYEVELPTDAIAKLESGMNIADEVLRYLISYPVPKSQRTGPANDDEDEEEGDEDKPVRAKAKVAAKAAQQEE